MAIIDSLLDSLRDQAASALTTARATTSRISNNAPVGVSNRNLNYTFRKPTLTPPPGFGDLLPDDTTGDTIRFLDSEAEKWLDKFFPEIQACLRTTPEEWLCGILTGQKPFGLDKAIFDLVWHNSRDREYKARNTEVRQIYNRFSNRGFTLPPGALVAATAQAEERASDAIAEVNRAQTLRDAEIKLDLLKFAEEQAIRLKLGVMQALADFYRQWIELPNKDVEFARVKAQSYAALQAALASYYNVELGFERLRLEAATQDVGAELDSDRNKIAAAQGTNASDALANAVRAFGDVAAAAANAQSALVADLNAGA